jgi:hypothetical protein
MFLSTWLFRFDKLSDEPKRFEAVFLFIFQVIWIMKTKIKRWFWVRTALDWFSGESIIQYHKKQGLQSQGVSLVGYSLEAVD